MIITHKNPKSTNNCESNQIPKNLPNFRHPKFKQSYKILIILEDPIKNINELDNDLQQASI